MRRDVLAVPSLVFKMVEQHPEAVMKWWPSVRSEVRRMADLVPLLFADIGSDLSEVLLATDAMGENEVDGGGFGIVGAVVGTALAESVFEKGGEIGHRLARRAGELSGLRAPGRELAASKPFTVLPNELFDGDVKWQVLSAGRWAYADHVTLGEARAVVKALDAVMKVPALHGVKLIVLEDNQPTSGLLRRAARHPRR